MPETKVLASLAWHLAGEVLVGSNACYSCAEEKTHVEFVLAREHHAASSCSHKSHDLNVRVAQTKG